MNWGTLVQVLLQAVGPVVVDVVRALADGDKAAYTRISRIIPSELRSEALLAAEKARERAAKEKANG